MFCHSTCKPMFLHAKRGQSKADTKGMVLQGKKPIFFYFGIFCCCFGPTFGLLGHQVRICKITHPLHAGYIEHSCRLSYQLRIKARESKPTKT